MSKKKKNQENLTPLQRLTEKGRLGKTKFKYDTGVNGQAMILYDYINFNGNTLSPGQIDERIYGDLYSDLKKLFEDLEEENKKELSNFWSTVEGWQFLAYKTKNKFGAIIETLRGAIGDDQTKSTLQTVNANMVIHEGKRERRLLKVPGKVTFRKPPEPITDLSDIPSPSSSSSSGLTMAILQNLPFNSSSSSSSSSVGTSSLTVIPVGNTSSALEKKKAEEANKFFVLEESKKRKAEPYKQFRANHFKHYNKVRKAKGKQPLTKKQYCKKLGIVSGKKKQRIEDKKEEKYEWIVGENETEEDKKAQEELFNESADIPPVLPPIPVTTIPINVPPGSTQIIIPPPLPPPIPPPVPPPQEQKDQKEQKEQKEQKVPENLPPNPPPQPPAPPPPPPNPAVMAGLREIACSEDPRIVAFRELLGCPRGIAVAPAVGIAAHIVGMNQP